MELKFKTNLKCEGCIQKVSDAPDHEPGVESWEVDLKSPDKTLFLQGKNIEISRIEAIFREKGYEAKEIKTFLKKCLVRRFGVLFLQARVEKIYLLNWGCEI